MASLVRAACLTNYAEVAQASGLNGARMLLDAVPKLGEMTGTDRPKRGRAETEAAGTAPAQPTAPGKLLF